MATAKKYGNKTSAKKTSLRSKATKAVKKASKKSGKAKKKTKYSPGHQYNPTKVELFGTLDEPAYAAKIGKYVVAKKYAKSGLLATTKGELQKSYKNRAILTKRVTDTKIGMKFRSEKIAQAYGISEESAKRILKKLTKRA